MTHAAHIAHLRRLSISTFPSPPSWWRLPLSLRSNSLHPRSARPPRFSRRRLRRLHRKSPMRRVTRRRIQHPTNLALPDQIEYIYVPGSPELATSPNFPDINPSPIHTPPIPNLTPSCSSSSGLSSGPVTPSPTMAGPVRSVREPRTPRSRRPYDREGRDILAAPRKADRATIRRRLRKLDELFELEDSVSILIWDWSGVIDTKVYLQLAPRQPAKRVSRKRSKATDIPIPVFPRKVVKKEVTKSESTTRPNLAPPVGPPTGRTHPTGFN